MTAPRRRWSFSLWTLFLVVTVACASAGWVAYQLNWIRGRHAALARIGYSDVEFDRDETAPPGLPLGLRAFGEPGWESLPLGRKATMREIRELHALFPEATIYLCGISISPEDSRTDSLEDMPFVRVIRAK
jgi:hypothetical protein